MVVGQIRHMLNLLSKKNGVEWYLFYGKCTLSKIFVPKDEYRNHKEKLNSQV